MKQLVQRHGINPTDRVLLVDQAFLDHFDRHAKRRPRSALAGARLQHPKLALLHRELDVLHIAIMPLEQFEGLREFGKGVGHRLFHRQRLGIRFLARRTGEILRGADAGDDVLALRIDKIFPVITLFAGRGIAGESDAGRTGLAHVSEDHRLDVDRRTPIGGDVVQTPIDLSALAVPAFEHGGDRAP